MRKLSTAVLAATLTLTIATPASASTRRPDIAGDWLAQSVATGAALGRFVGDRAWAIAWLSARRALDARTPESGQRSRFEDAAVATAVHDALAALAPARQGPLDDALSASLKAIPDGPGERAGIRAGQAAAARTLRERTGDGLDPASINRPFTPPPPATGVYQLPPGATATEGAGLGDARPFLLGDAARFRPGPPPAFGSAVNQRDLDEVRRFGSATSTSRTQEQTDIGRLWSFDLLANYTFALRPLVTGSGRPLSWKVGLLAAFTTATLDAMIAVSEAKFTYLSWRPVTAIRSSTDPSWTSLIPTPANPEYPGAHATYAGAAEQVLEHLTGPRTPITFTISVPVEGGRVVTREYRRGTPWSALTADNIDARVWVGAHFRTSDETGAALGRRVGDYDVNQIS